ncbi:type III pantothenate kinase [Flavobacterium cheniae]|uniref:Type III pantothenate kinase n=1 Tax=Flavobacterium cheniae TaxID=295428 RepID=A0A562KFR1_9FLAO|nr:type III pantothenate kinase [Flavobacterium cheniae]TDR20927.1 type III pantothenate kinase [Flavobacterium cheniae]TWH94197.1 type III pantothenate kinase [Flavobacterium cheniae]
MLLTIDVGNSRIKVAVFEHNKQVDFFIFETNEALKNFENIFQKYPNLQKIILSSVGKLDEEVVNFIKCKFQTEIIDHKSKFPFTNLYATPETLGIDRMVLAAGATLIYPNQNKLIIDAGTCITYDFVNAENQYLGGAISPGIKIRYKSLNNYTSKLPLLTLSEDFEIIGNSTKSAIHSGVINGVIFEIEGFISQYSLKNQDLTIILTGGDAEFLAKRLKSTIFANSNFLLESLNLLSLYTQKND